MSITRGSCVAIAVSHLPRYSGSLSWFDAPCGATRIAGLPAASSACSSQPMLWYELPVAGSPCRK
jgi:hypothetical protein